MKVFLIAAMSADGYIGQHDSQMTREWTSKDDIRLFKRLTQEAGAVVMGSKTYETIGRPLPERTLYVYTSRPEQYADTPGLVPVSEEPSELLRRIEADGYSTVAISGGTSIYTLFTRENLVDELYITIEPVLLGSGVPLLSGVDRQRLTLLEQSMLNENLILLHYAVVR